MRFSVKTVASKNDHQFSTARIHSYYSKQILFDIVSRPFSIVLMVLFIHVNSLSSVKTNLNFRLSKVTWKLCKTNNTFHRLNEDWSRKKIMFGLVINHAPLSRLTKSFYKHFFPLYRSTWILIKTCIYIIIYDQLSSACRRGNNKQRMHNNKLLRLQLIKSYFHTRI